MTRMEQHMRELAAKGYRFVTRGNQVLYLQTPHTKNAVESRR